MKKSKFIGQILKGFEILDYIPAQKGSNAKFIGKCTKCGNIITRSTNGFKFPNSRISCSCSYKYSHHNESYTRLYSEYMNMKGRVKGTRGGKENRKYYCDKGIKVCEEWMNPNGYSSFREWALGHGYNDNLTLDRIDGNKGYEPSNCRWVTIKEQNLNKSNTRYATINGERKTVYEWCELMKIDKNFVYNRLKRGFTCEEALLIPKGIRRKEYYDL